MLKLGQSRLEFKTFDNVYQYRWLLISALCAWLIYFGLNKGNYNVGWTWHVIKNTSVISMVGGRKKMLYLENVNKDYLK